MLEAIRTSLDGLSEDEKKHYVEKDGKFVLDVGPVDGMSLENVTGLKKTVETLRGQERKLKQELDELKTNFDGIDPEAARAAISKYDEIKGFDKDGKVKEAIEARTKDLVKQHQAKVDELEGKLTKMTGQLQEAIVTSKIVEALQKEGGNVTLLLPHVKTFVKMKEGADGNYYPQVVDEQGSPRVGDTAGNDMTILQRVQEMKTQDAFATAFKGAGSSGSGASGSDDRKSGGSGGSGISVVSGGHVSVSNIEDVASGKTKVNVGG